MNPFEAGLLLGGLETFGVEDGEGGGKREGHSGVVEEFSRVERGDVSW